MKNHKSILFFTCSFITFWAIALLWSQDLQAKTFIFKPVSAIAHYSDTANWINLDYPGRQIEYGDTIAFEKNGAFNQVIIDSSVNMFGYCSIGEEVTCIIPVGILFTIQRELPPQSIIEEKIRTSPSSILEVNGILNLNQVDGNFQGITLVIGTINSDAEYNFHYGSWQTIQFHQLSILGNFTGIATRIYADSMYVSTAGNVYVSSGYEFNNGLLEISSLLNNGIIHLNSETQLHAVLINNDGHIRAGAITGAILNSGSIEIVQHQANSETANIHDVINTGTIELFGSVNAPIFIHSIYNNGSFTVADYLNGDELGLTWLTIDGEVKNNKNWNQLGSGNNTNLSGNWINDSLYVLKGNVSFTSGNFTNNGRFEILNLNTNYAIKLINQCFNYGTMHVEGKLEVFGTLNNYKNLTIKQ